ncbi:MAG: Cof-type HAD-IIB family hydrolase [Erysipelotrichaceae bacterium]|nr:Cof-type HAD-IIB family hydrolase [Erysipelotrichaceae bacterium]
MHIVFFDIDQTLADGKKVPDSAKEALKILRANGDLVFLCTGRNIGYVRNNFADYADGFITNNGRLAYYKEEVIFSAPVEKETVKELLYRLRKLHAGAVFHSLNRGHYEGPEELYGPITATGDPGYIDQGVDEEKDYYNLDVSFKDKAHAQAIEEALKDLCVWNPHGPHPSADLTVIGVDKGDALKAVAKHFKVRREDTYAFGDGINDIVMIKAAGHGIAMGNAFKETKEAAEYVTDKINEDGVYNGLKHYGLLSKKEEVILETKRLVLRPWEASDAEACFKYAKDPQVGPAAGWPAHRNIEESKEIIEKVLRVPETYAIVLKETGEAIGSISLHFHSDLAEKDDEAELGYWLGVPHWGKGIMTEAGKRILAHGFQDLHLERIWAGYYEGNERSRRVQEKLGFRYVRTTEGLEVRQMQEFRTGHSNLLTKEDWLKTKPVTPSYIPPKTGD